jgi:hypothetical protein
MTAINFPDSPSNGDTHVVGGVTYTYDSTETKWKTTINSNAFLPLTGGTLSGNIVLGGEIQHDGDTDTNISFDADTIKFDTAGSERFRVDSSGRVGIGTNNPGSYSSSANNLVVQDTAGEGGITIVSSTTAGSNIFFADTAGTAQGQIKYQHAGDYMRFYTDGSERARITSTGDFRFNSGYGSVATAYGCRAWVNFNGTGAVAIRASGNVSSITDNGTGNYTVNFTTAMPDVNYCAVTDCGALTSGGTMAGNIATGSFRMLTMNGSFANEDRSIVFASVFR